MDPFEIEYIVNSFYIRTKRTENKTPAGVISHTGDWRDPNPLIGDNINEKRLKEIGEEGVLAMICDPTNVLVPVDQVKLDVRKNMLNVNSIKKRIIITSLLQM